MLRSPDFRLIIQNPRVGKLLPAYCMSASECRATLTWQYIPLAKGNIAAFPEYVLLSLPALPQPTSHFLFLFWDDLGLSYICLKKENLGHYALFAAKAKGGICISELTKKKLSAFCYIWKYTQHFLFLCKVAGWLTREVRQVVKDLKIKKK